jgi:hypothetical protein
MLARKEKLIPISTKPGVNDMWYFDIVEGKTIINVGDTNPNLNIEEFVRRFLHSPRNRWMKDFLV